MIGLHILFGRDYNYNKAESNGHLGICCLNK